jgi:predicted ATPase/class 3 adenylate cyclase
MRDLPRGTVTLLFTDIQGSTRLLQELGASYADALAEHRRLLRAALTGFGGVEVDTAGDALFYAFPDARAAVDAADAGQRALEPGPIRVRMGLHTGEPMLTEEGYVGIDVHKAARVMAAGHGGQVLLSEATAAAVGADGLSDLGRCRLKDMTEAEHLFQLGDAEFPPLKTLDATNLPVAASALIGREDEVAQLVDMLSDGARLVTVTGPGGTGKTRVALQAAAELVGGFHDGVFWVSLAAVTDPTLLVPEIARTLGADDLASYLRDREMLLLLDNLEQLLAAAAEIGPLLASAPRCRLLVTSRAPLRLSAEREFPLDPLPDADAVLLFCERALAAGRVVEPDEIVTDICARLDGLPLAIELAAARTRLLDPARLRDRLEHSLAVLTGGARDVAERQRTLRATIEWSHELLDDDARHLFAALAVFAGGATVEAVEEVCGTDLDVLERLVDSSLVKVTESAGHRRVLILETIREYAAERLAADETWTAELAARHANYYADLLTELDLTRRDPDRAADPARRLDAESANVRAAETWAGANDPAVQLRLLINGQSIHLRGSHDRYRQHLEGVLERAGVGPLLQSRGHALLSWVAYRQGDFARARDAALRALALAEETGDARALASAHTYLAAAQSSEGRYEDALISMDRAVEYSTAAGDRRGVLVCQVNLLDELIRVGDDKRALTLGPEVVATAREYGDDEILCVALVNLATVQLRWGDAAAARGVLLEAVELSVARRDDPMVTGALGIASCLAARDQDGVTAARLRGAVDRLCAQDALTLEPLEQQVYDETADLLARMEGIDVAAEVAVGREMSTAAAVALAIDVSRRPAP